MAAGRSARMRMLADLDAFLVPTIGATSRPVEDSDACVLGRLAFAAYQGTVDDEGESLEQQVAEMAATLAGRYGPLLLPSSRLIESAPHEAAAAVVVTWWDDLPFLAFCMTHPSARRRGLGRGLVTEAARELLAQGHRQVHLAVTRTNPAVRLYRSLGFRGRSWWCRSARTPT